MTNNRMNNNYNNDCNNDNRTAIYYDGNSDRAPRNMARPTDDAGAYTKAKNTSQTILISCATFALVAAIAVGGMTAGGLINQKPKAADTAPTSVATQADKVAQTARQAAPKTEIKQTNNAVKPTQNTAQQTAKQQTTEQAVKNTAQQPAKQTAQTNTQQAQKNEDKIEVVNGDRVYKDTKRQAPDKTGTPAHYYANGKTTYGFNWDYDADNGNFVVKCDYNFNQQQYDFTFYGTAPGTSHVTLYYYTSDTNKVPVNLTVTVDSNLNVTVG